MFTDLQAICLSFDHVLSCLFHHRNIWAQILLQRHYKNRAADLSAPLLMHFCIPCMPFWRERPPSNLSYGNALWDQQRFPQHQRLISRQRCVRVISHTEQRLILHHLHPLQSTLLPTVAKWPFPHDLLLRRLRTALVLYIHMDFRSRNLFPGLSSKLVLVSVHLERPPQDSFRRVSFG